MPKQKFCLGRKSTHNILFTCASIVLGLFAAFTFFPVVIDGAKAIDGSGDGIDIAVSDLEINMTPLINDMKIAKSTITVNTGSASGYQLFISTDSVDHQTMYLDGDPNNTANKIDPTTGTYDVPTTLGLNTWGYAVAGLGNFDDSYSTINHGTNSKFARVPLADSEQLIYEFDGTTSGNESDVYYGVRTRSDLLAGDYVAEVTYTAVPAAAPRTAKAIYTNDHVLTFVYDSNVYASGDSYTSYKGTTTVSSVWNVPMGNANGSRNDYSTMPWTANNNIYYVNFDSTFIDFKPINVGVWFYYCRYLREVVNIENFNTSEAISMERLFFGAGVNLSNGATINLNLDNLQTGSVKNMSQMFYQVGKKSTSSPRVQVNFGDLSSWDVSKVTNMANMFEGAGYSSPTWNVGDIGKWNVGGVTTMSGMFQQAGYYSSSLYIGNLGVDSNDPVNHPGWKPAKVTTMANMFNRAWYSIGTWNVGNIGSWNTEELSNMSNMFAYAGYNSQNFIIENLGDLNVGKVSNMETAFDRTGRNATTWNVGSLGYVDADHKGWNTGSVTNMYHLFYEAAYMAEEFDLGNIGSWNTAKTTRMRAMFYQTGYSAKTWNIGKLSYVDNNHQGWTINTSNTDMGYMFYQAGYSAEHVFDVGDLGEWKVSLATDMSHMFEEAGYSADTTWNIGNLGYIDADHPGWSVTKAKDMTRMFSSAGYSAPTWDIGNLDNWTVSDVTDMSYMFNDAGHSAATWNIGDLSGWSTVKVTNMSYMFNGAGYSATTTWDIGDLDGWTVDLVSSMDKMFYGAGYSADTTWNIGDISGWVTKSGVTHTDFINTNLHNTNTITEPVWN